MSWVGKAEDHASAHHTYEHLGYGENMRIHKVFVEGAKWQRDQLRTDEAVERMAQGILATFAEVIEAQDRRLPPTTDVQRRHAEKYARAAIKALVGEESRP
ncbi:MAG: hypothetical protein ACTMKZ_13560 [Brevibacterium aurantiacum]|uniref:Uncharacterized protein n=1 Tax=Brevibacterium aurantiacum TaxID=273384 RepID=A0A2H1I1R0_BREAU|nr:MULTISPECIES: hypothetical protein [Brevibacterium]AZL04998.1 hypothetical protein CXR24_04770 [Brevibacterium aurantiacum]AZL12195.1 hypothetical protein CXR25_04705 [Brevibacterium aurantiacum]AZT96422.1 hypothetical protein CXR27_04865 [Brevibacterium aurantiacum]RCS97303.1 hypothetical protein CIK61_04235 [Brevibacterium aurantiacum]SMX69098.1 hypothetical protein BAUR920_00608 [Brevibacterium aurantiacum]